MTNIRINADGRHGGRRLIMSVAGGCLMLASFASAAPQLPPPQQAPIQVGAEEVERKPAGDLDQRVGALGEDAHDEDPMDAFFAHARVTPVS